MINCSFLQQSDPLSASFAVTFKLVDAALAEPVQTIRKLVVASSQQYIVTPDKPVIHGTRDVY